MLLARRNTAPEVVIESAVRLLELYPEISNVELLQRLALDLGSEVTTLIPVTRVERLVREPALNRIRLGRREAPPSTVQPSEPPPLSEASDSRDRRRRPRSQVSLSAHRKATPDRKAAPDRKATPGRTAAPAGGAPSPSAQGPLPFNRLNPRVIQAVDEALLEAFTLGADSSSDAEVVDHFRDLDHIRARIRRTLEAK